MQPAAHGDRAALPQTSTAVRKLVGTLPFPIEIGRFHMDAAGVPWPRRSDAPVAFAFADRDFIFAALACRAGDAVRVHLCAEIVPLPYTVQSTAGRARLLGLMQALAGLPFGRVRLDRRKTICVEAELAIDAPFTPNRLIAAAALFVARARPVIDCIAARAVAAPEPAPAAKPPGRRAPSRAAPADRRR